MSVAIEKFGKDHWSTLAYIETRCVNHKGIPNREHMRCDLDRHPGLVNLASNGTKKYPTLLKGGEELPDHDDWDCVDDLIAVGFLEWGGTGINPVFKMTPDGLDVAARLRKHKGNGGRFGNFEYQVNNAL